MVSGTWFSAYLALSVLALFDCRNVQRRLKKTENVQKRLKTFKVVPNVRYGQKCEKNPTFLKGGAHSASFV